MKKGVDKQHLFLYYMSSSAAVHYRKQNNDAWLSLVERCVRDAEVAGSNPVAPTIQGFRYMGERILGRGNLRGF